MISGPVVGGRSAKLQEDYQSSIDLLRKETGKTIRFQRATDYAAVIEGQRSGKVDIALYGALSYLVARTSGVRATAVAAALAEKGGSPGYRSYGVVKTGSPIHDLAGFKGKKVCLVDPNSTSGYLYPRAGLIDAGVNPDSEITAVLAGTHDASALGVAKGQCDAGFAYDAMVDKKLIEKGQLKAGELTTVWKSGLIPGSPIAISDDLDPALKDKIAKVIQEHMNIDYLESHGFCTPGKCMVDESGDWGFVKVADTFFDPVRHVCEVTKAKSCTAAE
ncbi:phosphate/phosphite/phosphonate ABC transporter substrate-binding protein [Frankia sp. B2]|uniref:phosphate/phosphite/phosphonate ABC transporter substrate-binding protein n=1 Tax=unclassified Frankia TaxID=2632575 RepID=UPI000461703D|nr:MULTISPECIES: phosphate/phosphite/phosphonate ABC transporter substrate-binding protein [unclassified Frankia]KDA40753.1 ABC-type phosphate/phosphonate transport system, periplasmic component [Frankia sp. BMG5.23]TFE27087.1 phosphate/phosphite/phosphonate ABC transporter substrate-binding protein [Frankia sp. B2]